MVLEKNIFEGFLTYMGMSAISPVKLLEDPKQIATQILFALTMLDLYYKHTKSIPKSENMKFDFFHCLSFVGNFTTANLRLIW